MHLTKLVLDPSNRDALRDLGSPSDLHKTLGRAFPDADSGGPGRVLFRVEPRDDCDAAPPVVLVQSEKEPDWSQLPPRWGRTCGVKPFDPTPELFPPGRRLRFRLLANPTVKKEGQRHGLLREPEQLAWLARKAADAGFRIDPDAVRLVPLGTARSGRGKGQRSWFGVRFEGTLAVTDPTTFVEALRCGVGSGKAFGFGLLSVSP